MAGKIYFIFITLFVIFTNRYQAVTTAQYGIFDYLFLVRDVLLLLAGFAYFFKRSVFDKKYWKYLWWFLLGQLIISLVKQLLPGSYYGDIEDGQIGVNLFAFVLSQSLLIPLYIAAYRLQTSKKIKDK